MMMTRWRFSQQLVLVCLIALSLQSCRSTPQPQPAPQPPAKTPTVQPTTAPTVSITSPKLEDPRKTLPYLASDALSGRAPGDIGLIKAGEFIASQFDALGLPPAPGMTDHFQPFIMPMAATLGPDTGLLLNDKSLVLDSDFSPLSLTADGPFNGQVIFAGYGITNAQQNYDDYKNLDVHHRVVLAMREEPRDEKGHSRFAPTTQPWSAAANFSEKAKTAAAHGAAALLLVTPPSDGDPDQVMHFFGEPGSPSSPIPVIQISRRTADLMLAVGGAPDLQTLQHSIDTPLKPRSLSLSNIEVSGRISLRHTSAEVRNVIAYLPGKGPYADEFIVVGAHYDHLGTGQVGHMLGPIGSIYHGADDNASGTAAVLELADLLKNSAPLPRSVLFVLFTAEEEGLVGSDWFVSHPPIPLEKIVAMLNLDMVGRLKDENLLIGGWGTAANFDSIVKQATAGLPIKTQSFEKGGLGPSDHMSFALHKIPVLFLFTGLHADYHRPTDTVDKINFPGIDEIANISQRIVSSMATMPRQAYDASSDSKSTMAFTIGHGSARRASLGIVPEFNSVQARTGVPISGVSDSSPAELAGLRGGDIITSFDGKRMTNLQDLSDALSQADPGQNVTLKFIRDGKEQTTIATLSQRKD